MIKEKLKAIWKWLKWIIVIIGAALAGVVLGKVLERAVIKEVNKKWNWSPAGLNKIAVMDANNNIIKTVVLPLHPDTGKQIKYQDIAAVGIAGVGQGKNGGKVHVEIKHTPTTRR